MGYTHYWELRKKDESEICDQLVSIGLPPGKDLRIEFNKETWDELIETLKPILLQGIGRKVISGGKDFSCHDDIICFNGRGNDAHETFFISRVRAGGGHIKTFGFCKTARKPYDEYVVRALIEFERYFGDVVKVSSDGEWDDVKTQYAHDNIDQDKAEEILEYLYLNVGEAIRCVQKSGWGYDTMHGIDLGPFFNDYIVDSYLDNPNTNPIKSYIIGDFCLVGDHRTPTQRIESIKKQLKAHSLEPVSVKPSPNEGYYTIVFIGSPDAAQQFLINRGFDQEPLEFYEYKEVVKPN